MSDTVGRFRNEQSRARFRRAFDAAMVGWPDHEDRVVQTAFGSTAVSVSRRSGHRDPLVLLQGGNSTIAIWARFAEAWREDRPIIAIDTVWDAGRSVQRRPIQDGAEVASWLDQTLAGLDIDRAHLLGFSYGAWAALNQAAAVDERLLSVTAIEPPGAIVGMPVYAWWKMLRSFIGGHGNYRSYLAWVRGGRLPESATLALLMSARTDFIQRGTPRPRRLTEGQWAGLNVPAMVMLGGRSRLVPTRAATTQLQRFAPQVELHQLPQASHAMLVDEPHAVIDQVAEFLRRHDRARR